MVWNGLRKGNNWCEIGWVFSWDARVDFHLQLDLGSYIIPIVKTVSKKIRALIRCMTFLSPEVALYIYKFTVQPCMEYCCHVWSAAPSCYLELLNKLQKCICRTVGPSLAASLEPSAHRRNIVNLSLFYRFYFGRCLSDSIGFTSLFLREVYSLFWQTEWFFCHHS